MFILNYIKEFAMDNHLCMGKYGFTKDCIVFVTNYGLLILRKSSLLINK